MQKMMKKTNMMKQKKKGITGKKLMKVFLAVQGVLGFTAVYLASGNLAYASEAAGVIEAQFDTLLGIVTSIISSIGTIITLWGISEWGIAFQGQDGTMQAHAFKRIAGGLVMLLAPQLITYF